MRVRTDWIGLPIFLVLHLMERNILIHVFFFFNAIVCTFLQFSYVSHYDWFPKDNIFKCLLINFWSIDLNLQMEQNKFVFIVINLLLGLHFYRTEIAVEMRPRVQWSWWTFGTLYNGDGLLPVCKSSNKRGLIQSGIGRTYKTHVLSAHRKRSSWHMHS